MKIFLIISESSRWMSAHNPAGIRPFRFFWIDRCNSVVANAFGLGDSETANEFTKIRASELFPM